VSEVVGFVLGLLGALIIVLGPKGEAKKTEEEEGEEMQKK